MILVFAPNRQIFSLYVKQQIKQDPKIRSRNFVCIRDESQIPGYPNDNTQVVMIGNATVHDINLRLDARRRYTNIKSIADII